MTEPQISIGIVSAQEIHFSLDGTYTAKGEVISGQQVVSFEDGGILWHNNLYRELTFVPKSVEETFSLYDVTIGKNFHWERQETQIFQGTLKLIVEETKITAINLLPAENYLLSVISSEMKPTSPLEFLKAHAIISRSWLFAQMAKKRREEKRDEGFFTFAAGKNEHIRWYSREEHTNYDFCADDHCQRYQGITDGISGNVVEAVKATRGLVLMSGKEICDARFSKCCGGVTEEYESCWENSHYPYLTAVTDRLNNDEIPLPNLTCESEADRWIRSTPDSLCNTGDSKMLAKILNNYDCETKDFFRWTVRYGQQELAAILKEKTKIDFGFIIDLVPLQRGKSGRIIKLKVIGSLQTQVYGKELEIRRILSPTHLYSSAFVVDKGELLNGFPSGFTILGAGWGHGVGLCQIGAAVMGEKGYPYEEILHQYYKESEIKEIY